MNVKILKSVVAILLLNITTATASIINLEFEFSTGQHYEYSLKENSNGDSYMGSDFINNFGSGTISMQFDTDLISTYEYLQNIQSGSVTGQQNLKRIYLSGADINSSLNVEDDLRALNPDYNNSTNMGGTSYAQQYYTDWDNTYTDNGSKNAHFSEYENSQNIINDSVSNGVRTIEREQFSFYEYISLGFANDFNSLTDPELYTIDNLLSDISLSTGYYNIYARDYSYTQTNTDGVWKTIYTETSGEQYSARINLVSINGTSAERYLAQVPEPSTLAIFALGIMGLASRRFKKQ